MTLLIEHPEAEQLALELARRTHLPVDEALAAALRAELARWATLAPGGIEEALAIARHCAALPDRDLRSPDEILGYNERGTWD